jgi:hypothetical protein
MASIVVAGDTSGTVTLAAPAVSGTTTLTLPATSGTVLTSASTITPSAGTVNQAALATGVAGTGPTFRAYLASNQSISAATGTKLNFDTEMWDTNSNYDTINKRFTPTVAGYYQVNIGFFGGNSTDAIAILYKNGVETGTATGYATAVNARPRFAGITYLNGTTDYIEAYAYSQGAVTVQGGSSSYTEFSAALIRSA